MRCYCSVSYLSPRKARWPVERFINGTMTMYGFALFVSFLLNELLTQNYHQVCYDSFSYFCSKSFALSPSHSLWGWSYFFILCKSNFHISWKGCFSPLKWWLFFFTALKEAFVSKHQKYRWKNYTKLLWLFFFLLSSEELLISLRFIDFTTLWIVRGKKICPTNL